MTDESKQNSDDNSGVDGGDSDKPVSEPTPEARGGDRTTEEGSGQSQADVAGTDSKAGGGDSDGDGDKGVSDGGVNTAEKRASTGAASSRAGQDTKDAGYKAGGTNDNDGGVRDPGQAGRVEATKVTPSDESAEHRSVTTHTEEATRDEDQPRFRGPRPFRRWKQRAYDRKKETANRP